ncbi:hypothetical protein HPC49_21860 [Pyxidicoccus fallax]|uniref:Peptidase metallopeptidase domain-containing protein n=1 Tax=Pyxidicoccus fallax TaxID=394095 RepID=A0A848LN03_9BACT|nr:hypothetical protein [Pyxidicoccus fallax]NMO19225.1 hypothetical protein [Pyxidicoccus fallax]NPC80858.1 hypothetical protein [Pyxidicoccus fallax]
MMTAAMLLTLLGGAPSPSAEISPLQTYQQALSQPFDDERMERLLALLPRFGEFYVFEGDLLLTAKEVRAHLVAAATASGWDYGPELLVAVSAGQLDYWKDRATRELSYAVDRASFADEAEYQQVVRNMRAAAADWEAACESCGLSFTHRPEHDGAPSHERVRFIVRKVDAKGDFIAAGFYPSWEVERRLLLIDGSYFGTTANQVGVLRHELGHISGYRHEHIQGIKGCFKERGEWWPLTAYDPQSVMHYLCGKGGTLELKLSPTDIQGHQKLYR